MVYAWVAEAGGQNSLVEDSINVDRLFVRSLVDNNSTGAIPRCVSTAISDVIFKKQRLTTIKNSLMKKNKYK